MIDMIFHHNSSSTVIEEVLIDDRRNGDDVCAVSKDTDGNNKLAPCDTSRRKDNKEAMVNKMFHDISRSIINEEVLIDDKRNGGDDYMVSQDAGRNNKPMPYDTPRGEDNEKVMVEVSNYYHLEYDSQVNRIRKSKRQKRLPITKKKYIFMVNTSSNLKRHLVSNINRNDNI